MHSLGDEGVEKPPGPHIPVLCVTLGSCRVPHFTSPLVKHVPASSFLLYTQEWSPLLASADHATAVGMMPSCSWKVTVKSVGQESRRVLCCPRHVQGQRGPWTANIALGSQELWEGVARLSFRGAIRFGWPWLPGWGQDGPSEGTASSSPQPGQRAASACFPGDGYWAGRGIQEATAWLADSRRACLEELTQKTCPGLGKDRRGLTAPHITH